MSGLLHLALDARPNIRYRLWPFPSELPDGLLQEAAQYLIVLSDSDDYETVSLSVDDKPLEALRPELKRQAKWRWSPGFYSGTVAFHLKSTTRDLAFSLNVDPDRTKLTKRSYQLMVQQVLEDSSQIISLSSFRTSLAAGDGSRRPPIAMIEYLNSRMDEIDDAIREIQSNPLRNLRHLTRTEPFKGLTPYNSRDVAKAYSTQPLRDAASAASILPTHLRGTIPIKTRAYRKHLTNDTYENRAVKWILATWRIWMRNARVSLARPDMAEIELRSVWTKRCGAMESRLGRLLQREIFDGVGDLPGPPTTTSVFRLLPVYEKVFRIHRNFALGVAAVVGEFLNVPLARTYQVYEIWVYLRLVRILNDLYQAKDGAHDQLLRQDPLTKQLSLQPVGSRVNYDRVALEFQRRFNEFWIDPTGTGSLSRIMIPDILVLKHGDDKENESAIVFDAKYRVGTALSDAITSIHTYRDALVQDNGTNVTRLVVGAYVLTPQRMQSEHIEWRILQAPDALFSSQYQDLFAFGAIEFRPDMPYEKLRESIARVLKASGSN